MSSRILFFRRGLWPPAQAKSAWSTLASLLENLYIVHLEQAHKSRKVLPVSSQLCERGCRLVFAAQVRFGETRSCCKLYFFFYPHMFLSDICVVTFTAVVLQGSVILPVLSNTRRTKAWAWSWPRCGEGVRTEPRYPTASSTTRKACKCLFSPQSYYMIQYHICSSKCGCGWLP